MVNMAGYKGLIIGSRVTEPGSSEKFHTGDWRSKIPVIDKAICIGCLSCWIECPDNSIDVGEDGAVSIKLTHCKGCGICSTVCPKNAIAMKEDVA